MSKTLEAQFAEYGSFHRTHGNEVCHFVGIPLIVLSLFGLLGHVPLVTAGALGAPGEWTVALSDLLLLGAVAYYASLDLGLALLMLLVGGILDGLGRLVSWELALGLFVVGWIFQFAGHAVYEKKSPAFTRNLVHLLVGPLWILARATHRA
jgi:uncharacterized membrane protein YGL010W